MDLLKKQIIMLKLVKSKIPSISGLVTNSTLTVVENKIPDVSNLVKTDYNAKISDIGSKYITAADYNKFTKNIVDNSIKSKNFVNKSAIAKLDKNVATLATKAELKTEQAKIIKLQAFDSSYYRGKSHFKDDGTQNYLVMYRYFKKIGDPDYI